MERVLSVDWTRVVSTVALTAEGDFFFFFFLEEVGFRAGSVGERGHCLLGFVVLVVIGIRSMSGLVHLGIDERVTSTTLSNTSHASNHNNKCHDKTQQHT
jgi:hypothetical protein